MQKENNCRCVVCQVERSLLNSLSTQTARTHFQALARNHSILNHFDSPADVIVQLHEHERTEAVNHKLGTESCMRWLTPSRTGLSKKSGSNYSSWRICPLSTRFIG